MKRCDKGHYYDETKHSLCPHCGVNVDLNLGITMPKMPNQAGDLEKTQARYSGANDSLGVTKPRIPEGKQGQNDGKTVAIVRKQIGLDPVVGWLVCVEGPDKGRDYRIRSERNFIGRSEKMDIKISGDEAISRENHAIISYSPKKKQFRVYAGDSRGLVYLNDDEVVVSELLKPHDVIELGQTKLMFVPFCGDHFQWE